MKNINFPAKEWVYLALQPTDFVLNDHDRDIFVINDISNYIRVAETIRVSGLPYYKEVCVHLQSNRNIPAWERYLDYPDNRLLQ